VCPSTRTTARIVANMLMLTGQIAQGSSMLLEVAGALTGSDGLGRHSTNYARRFPDRAGQSQLRDLMVTRRTNADVSLCSGVQ